MAYDADKGFQYGAILNIYNYGDGTLYPNYGSKIYLEASFFHQRLAALHPHIRQQDADSRNPLVLSHHRIHRQGNGLLRLQRLQLMVRPGEGGCRQAEQEAVAGPREIHLHPVLPREPRADSRKNRLHRRHHRAPAVGGRIPLQLVQGRPDRQGEHQQGQGRLQHLSRQRTHPVRELPQLGTDRRRRSRRRLHEQHPARTRLRQPRQGGGAHQRHLGGRPHHRRTPLAGHPQPLLQVLRHPEAVLPHHRQRRAHLRLQAQLRGSLRQPFPPTTCSPTSP